MLFTTGHLHKLSLHTYSSHEVNGALSGVHRARNKLIHLELLRKIVLC